MFPLAVRYYPYAPLDGKVLPYDSADLLSSGNAPYIHIHLLGVSAFRSLQGSFKNQHFCSHAC